MVTPSPVLQAFSRQSTSLKILILLSLALLPLGLIASLASLETAKTNRANREAAARLLANESADRLNLFVDRTVMALHGTQRQGHAGCEHVASALNDPGVAIAMFDAGGGLICSTRAIDATLPLRSTDMTPIAMIDQDRQAVRLLVGSGATGGWALAEIPQAVLARISHPHAVDGTYAVTLLDGTGRRVDVAALRALPLGRDILADLPVAGGQLRLSMTVAAAPLSANEILLTILPILMWLAGAAIGWLVVDRLILRPLGQLQAAINRYNPDDPRFEMPALTSPAFEIRALGDAFYRATQTIARHERDLEDGLARQTKLTREVHHRVKNNLQVVASLLNIHARNAQTVEAADAYATIQRRVDALALVHRSHYAELEVNHGVALRPLIGELASNLRASLSPGEAQPVISLNLRLLHANQDVAVSVAFLIVELVETAMLRVPGAAIAIALETIEDRPDRARLVITSVALRREAAAVDDRYIRFERVTEGLSRQLRSPLSRDEEIGRTAIEIGIMPPI